MAFNGSGTFNLAAGNPVVTGTTISSTTNNNTLSDIATGLSTCVLKDGTQTITANIPMSSYRITGLGAATAATDAARADQVQNGLNYLTSVAGTNTITATATPTPSSIGVGQLFRFIPANTNTGATTLNISSLGAGAVQMGGVALAGGELRANIPVIVEVTAATPVFGIVANGLTAPFIDSNALIKGSADGTKLARFEVDGLTTATTRVYTLQDSNDTLVGRATTDTLTNKTLTSPVLDTGVSGTAIADQTAMEAASSTSLVVTPGRAHFHPGVAKCWGMITPATTVTVSYPAAGVSVVRNGAGDFTVTHGVTFSSANYAAFVSAESTSSANPFVVEVYARTTTTVRLYFISSGVGLADPTSFHYVCFGDL